MLDDASLASSLPAGLAGWRGERRPTLSQLRRATGPARHAAGRRPPLLDPELAAGRARAGEEMQPLLGEASRFKAESVDLKERLKQRKKDKAATGVLSNESYRARFLRR